MAKPSAFKYNVKDSIVWADAREAKFGVAKKGERTPSPDMRRAINPNIDAVRKTAADVKIAPEHEVTLNEMLKEYRKTKNGPGTYDPTHDLTEQRQGMGVGKFNYPYYETREYKDERKLLFPNIKLTKPNKLVFKYYKPAEVGPEHTPDKVENPGRWVFYDVDLDAVRADLARNVYLGAKDEDPVAFKEREEFQQMLEAHIKRKNNRRPEHADYDPYK